MAFTSFEAFLHAKNEIKFFQIEKCECERKRKYFFYKIKALKDEYNPQEENFTYLSINENSFQKNDEVLICNQESKILLFKNFTQKKDNFKEAKFRQLSFSLLLFSATFCFGILCVVNNFLGVDIAFFIVFLCLFIVSLINLTLLKKRIRILNALDKEKILSFLQSKK